MSRTAVLISAMVAAASALTWTNTGDLEDALIVRDLSMGPGGRLYAAASTDTASGAGAATVFYSSDFSDWQSVGPMPGVQVITTLVKSDGDTLFAATRANGSGSLYFSADGLDWTYRSSPGTVRFGNTMTCLVQDAGGRLLAGSNFMGMSAAEVYYSDNRGMTWARPATMPNNADQGFLFRAADGSIFCGTVFSAARVMKTTDRGANWAYSSPVGNPKPAMTQSVGGRLYVASRSGSTGAIDISTDGGANWTTSYTGGSVRSLYRASDGFIYAGLDSVAPDTAEVIVSTNDGATWVSAGRLGGARRIYRLVDVDSSGTHFLYAATGPNGDVLRAPLGPVGVAEPLRTPRQFAFDGGYPNPFSGRTTIRYALLADCRVNLRVCDATGSCVRVLADAHQRAGSYRILWDGTDTKCRNLPVGVYFCRMVAGGQRLERKVVLTR